MDESTKMQLRESYSMQRIDDEFEEAGKRLAELEQAEKELGETQLLLIEEQERNQRLIQRLSEVERELEDERMISMKRFVETGRADRFAIEQRIKALEHEASLWPDDLTECSHVKSSILCSAEKLRQQLNGDDQ